MTAATEPDELELLIDFFYIVPIGLMRFRTDGTIDLMNPMVPRLLLPLVSNADLENAYTALGPLVPDMAQRLNALPGKTGVIIDHERHAATPGAHRVVLSLTIYRITRDSFIALIEDVTQQAEQERQLRETTADLAWRRNYDTLTGVANRSLLDLRLAESRQVAGERPILFFVDIVGASAITEAKGYNAGDVLMVGIAQRLNDVAGPDNLVARIAGDHFAVLCRRLREDEVTGLGGRIRAAIAAPFMVAGEPSRVSAIVTHAVVEHQSAFDLVQAADKAKQQAKLLVEIEQDAERNRQKMEALGRSLGGCAHEISNILQPISLLTQEMIDHEPDPVLAKPLLEVMLDCSRQACQILGDLLAFSRPGTRTREILDLRLLVTTGLGLARQAVPATILISTVTDGPLPSVAVNRTALNQVLLNLATNAAWAMDGKGTLTIALDEYVKDFEPASAEQPNHFARIRMTDTGAGMSKAVLDRVFEPFFTTKPVGQGTGLGLTVVYGLVKEMGGTITLASEPGRGATATILIPAVNP